ncbi:hypothetical protein ACU8KH_05499 [Lachancea thermotolerans]
MADNKSALSKICQIVIGSLVCDSAKLHNDTLSRSDDTTSQKFCINPDDFFGLQDINLGLKKDGGDI